MRAAPAMLDDNVFSIVRVAGNGVNVYDFSIGNSVYFIEWLAMSVATQRANIASLMKPGVNNATCRVRRIAHKTVLTTFPRRRFHALVVALYVLVERGAVA